MEIYFASRRVSGGESVMRDMMLLSFLVAVSCKHHVAPCSLHATFMCILYVKVFIYGLLYYLLREREMLRQNVHSNSVQYFLHNNTTWQM